MRAGESFEIPVNDVMSRTHWLREYLDDYKLESRKDLGTRYDEDNVELGRRPAKSKGKGKFDKSIGARRLLARPRSRRGASRRRSPREPKASSAQRSRSRKHSRSVRRRASPRRIQGLPTKPRWSRPRSSLSRSTSTVSARYRAHVPKVLFTSDPSATVLATAPLIAGTAGDSTGRGCICAYVSAFIKWDLGSFAALRSRLWWWGTSRLSQLSQVAVARGIEWGVVARPAPWVEPLVMEDVDPFRHLDLAKQAHHPALFHSALDDTDVFAVEFFGLLGSDIVRWRRLIIAEITKLKDELDEVTAAWLESLPPHGKIACKADACPNVPLLLNIGLLF